MDLCPQLHSLGLALFYFLWWLDGKNCCKLAGRLVDNDTVPCSISLCTACGLGWCAPHTALSFASHSWCSPRCQGLDWALKILVE